jgi:uncharacterized protein YyaL (SSP411 family)
LARITGDTDLDGKAAKIGRAFSGQVTELPSGYTQFLVAVDFGIGPSYEIVIVGPRNAKDTVEMLERLKGLFIPNKVIIFRPSDQESPDIDSIAPFIKNYISIDGKATAYVCLNNACKKPTTDITEMLRMIESL